MAIVGAGPAGSAAAITLARAGREVALIDKARFPRDKFCGDGLTAGALRRLEALGLDRAEVPSWHEIGEVCLRSPGGRSVRYPLPEGPGVFAAVARRRELDAALVALARQAGAAIHEGHAVTGATQDGDRVALEVDGMGPVDAAHVVAADGMWSPMRKLLGLAVPGYRGEWHAFRQYVHDVSPAAADELWVMFEPDLLPGYFWSFPVGDGDANIGFGIVRGGPVTTQEMNGLWPDLLRRPHIARLLGPDARPEAPHRAWPIPARVDRMVLTDGRVIFTGDAAATTDPMTGEGIGQALATGTWAASAVLDGGDDPREVARRYEAAVRRHLVPDHRLARTLSGMLGSRPGAEFSIGASGLTPWTRRNFARWLFEDYPRAMILTPRRWHRGMFTGPGAFCPVPSDPSNRSGDDPPPPRG